MSSAVESANFKRIALGAGIGLAYGVCLRLGYRLFPNRAVFQVVSIGFILLLP